ncbi:NADH-ubiquinone oxidoreductase-F iron-sulfur binding region domain-containing protein [Mycolicibacterium sp. Y3]
MTTTRLLTGHEPGLAAHRQRHGELPAPTAASLAGCVTDAGLTGRGGAGFPTGRKIAAVTGRKPVVIGNGAEGEPLSAKDATLLTCAPHLVLDGLSVAATAVAADSVVIYVPRRAIAAVRVAVAERAAANTDRRRIAVVEAPDRFVAGEESAVVSRIEGGPASPRHRTVLTTTSGVRRRPTLVNNVETLAHIGLIARYGPAWFRAVGDHQEPGTMLVTLSGSLAQPGVVEVPTGSRLTDLLTTSGRTDLRMVRAVLVGGYHGSWIPVGALTAQLSRAGLAALGATPGAGVVHVLGRHECGLERTAAIASYLAGQSARQCGPCLNGLPRLAQLLDQLAFGAVDDALVDELQRTMRLVDGRGACRHPDGTARMVRTALTVFAGDVAQHRRGRCEALPANADHHVRATS